MLELPPATRELIAAALDMRANWIETNDVALTHNDVHQMLESSDSLERHQIKELIRKLRPLDEHQRATVSACRTLAAQMRGHAL